MKVHHSLSHNESLTKETSICSIENCENKIHYYPSDKNGLLCSSCVEDGKNAIHTDKVSKEDITNNTVEKVSAECKNCGDVNEVIPSRLSEDHDYLCSRKCLDGLNSDRMSGDGNPRYSGGESFASHYNKSWREVREACLSRDEHTCVICSSSNNLHAHHLKAVKLFEKPEDAHFLKNAVTLCASCHPKVEHGKISIPSKLIEKYKLVQPETIHTE